MVALATKYGASTVVVTGENLLTDATGPFPLIHAVGRASVRAPRLVDMVWGDPTHPKVTLVGKGVVFDTGGLDIKPPANMFGAAPPSSSAAISTLRRSFQTHGR